MPKLAKSDNQPLFRQQPKAVTHANLLGDLYWYVCVIEAGGFSAAAEQTGVGKSSLSRRIAQLERQLNAQLLNRSARLCTMTTIGEQVYRHALDMVAALDAVLLSAQESATLPGGLLKLAVPSALADWALATMASFQRRHPEVQFALSVEDGPIDLGVKRLDLALTLGAVSTTSSSMVARELAELNMAIVASPALIKQLGHPKKLATVNDQQLITTGSAALPDPWQLAYDSRRISHPALVVESAQTALKAACAGLGLAYLPLHTCQADLAAQRLELACPNEALGVVTLRALTLPHKGISSATRHFIEHVKQALQGAGF